MKVKRVLVPLLLLALVAAAAAVVWHLRPTEEKRIRKQVQALADRASKAPGESTVVMVAKMQTLSDLFTASFTVELEGFPLNGAFGREEIGSLAARLRPMFRSLALSFHDLSITRDPPDTATVTLTARLTAEPVTGGRDEDTREIRCTMKKVDGTWRFANFEEARVLER